MTHFFSVVSSLNSGENWKTRGSMNVSLLDKFFHCFGVGIASDLKAVAVEIKLPIYDKQTVTKG